MSRESHKSRKKVCFSLSRFDCKEMSALWCFNKNDEFNQKLIIQLINLLLTLLHRLHLDLQEVQQVPAETTAAAAARYN